jgi:hypothetical protein
MIFLKAKKTFSKSRIDMRRDSSKNLILKNLNHSGLSCVKNLKISLIDYSYNLFDLKALQSFNLKTKYYIQRLWVLILLNQKSLITTKPLINFKNLTYLKYL